MRFARATIFLALCSCVAPACWPQNLRAWTDAYVRNLGPTKHFRGVVVAQHAGELVVEESFGLASEEWQVPDTIDTKFEIASLTKQFTAAAVLQLVDVGKLKVEDPVTNYYPDAPAAWKGITVHQLLTHTSGLPNNSLENYTKGLCVPYTPQELIRTFTDRPLSFPPGTQWRYTNTEYYLLAYLIEKLSGESYGDYLQRHIFQPLQMLNSGFSPTSAAIPKMAEGYTRDGDVLRHRDYFDRSLEIGAGGIHSTAEDLLLWNRALDTPSFLSARALSLMFTAHPPGNYGFGWFVESSPRVKIFHEGGDPGFAAFEARYPDEKLVVVVLANEDDAPVREVADAVAEEILRRSVPPTAH